LLIQILILPVGWLIHVILSNYNGRVTLFVDDNFEAMELKGKTENFSLDIVVYSACATCFLVFDILIFDLIWFDLKLMYYNLGWLTK